MDKSKGFLFPIMDNVNSSRNVLPKFAAGSLLLFILDSTGKAAITKRLKYIKDPNNKGLFFSHITVLGEYISQWSRGSPLLRNLPS